MQQAKMRRRERIATAAMQGLIVAAHGSSTDGIKDEIPQVAVVLADILLDELDRDAVDPTYNELAAALEAAQQQVEGLLGEVAYWRSKADPAARQMLADLEGRG